MGFRLSAWQLPKVKNAISRAGTTGNSRSSLQHMAVILIPKDRLISDHPSDDGRIHNGSITRVYRKGRTVASHQFFRAPCATQWLNARRSHLESFFLLCGIQISREVRLSSMAIRLLSIVLRGVMTEPNLVPFMRLS